MPLNTNMTFITNSVYHYSPARLVPVQGNENFETDPNGYSLPRWGLSITNRVMCMMVDNATGRLVDYVQLNGLNGTSGSGAEIGDVDNALDFAGLWSTNRLEGTTNSHSPYSGTVQPDNGLLET